MFPSFRALAALVVFTALLTPAVHSANSLDWSPYLHAQRLVAVRGHRLNVYCTGHGSPTVVLGSDGDDPTSAWRFVQPSVARITRVCSYDTPGFGFSDPAVGSGARSAVDDLHAALARADVAGRIVFVGYSLSGLYARLYADRFPRDVAGMVLVSPNVPNQDELIARAAPMLAPSFGKSFDAYLSMCLDAARRGTIRLGTPAYNQCIDSPDPTLPPALITLKHRQWESLGLWSSFVSEQEAQAASSAAVVREQRSYGDMPLIVLTTTKDIQALPLPANQKVALLRAWLSAQRAIARLSSRGIDFVVAGSSSSIPIDRPRAVISAIDEVVAQSR